nr:GrBNV_gp43-like protein [Oryctes rhinoceros nudivirus]
MAHIKINAVVPTRAMSATLPSNYPPKLELSEINHPNIKYIYNDKHSECYNSVPSIKSLVDMNSYVKKFAPCNEIEYSANIKFKNMTLDPQHAVRTTRYYFADTIKLYYNDDYISTKYFANADEVDGCIFTRFDYSQDGMPNMVTTKLKLIKRKFNYCGVTYSLTGSIEIEFPELLAALKARPQPNMYTRLRVFTHWYVSLVAGDGQRYVFRVAFRQINGSNGNYECNIECEDKISGPTFILCFDLLSKYYKRQYFQNGQCIQPIIAMNYDTLKLTKEQKHIIPTIRLEPKHHAIDDVEIGNDFQMLLKFMGLQSVTRLLGPIEGLPICTYATEIDEDCESISDYEEVTSDESLWV